jgi:hypothetical protein
LAFAIVSSMMLEWSLLCRCWNFFIISGYVCYPSKRFSSSVG